jgi:hypothetical protein
MPDIELAREAAGSLELLLNNLSLEGKHLANGLEVVQPSPWIATMRVQTIRAKLTHALRLVVTLEAVLKQ